MLNFTRTMALELAEHRIRVNAIAPDYTVTPGTRGNIKGPVDPASWVQPTQEHERATALRIPLGRAGVDTECGNLAVFLCSSMSDYITGVVVPVDGGSWASSGWIRNPAGRWVLTGETGL
jgi:NAD(P)-dependent dehydrogenase (short-subunit alcohol dehydrogenase family)